MRNINVVFVIILVIISCTNGSYDPNDNLENDRYVEYYDGGVTKVMGRYSNGLKDGVFVFFREDGTIREINDYKSDSLINIALLDSTELCYQSTHKLLYHSNRDTLSEVQNYTFEIGFKNKPIGEVEVIIENKDSLNGVIDTVAILKPLNGYYVEYQIDTGLNVLQGSIIDRVQVKLDSGTLDLEIPFGFEIELVGN